MISKESRISIEFRQTYMYTLPIKSVTSGPHLIPARHCRDGHAIPLGVEL
jgi:hypothetical protein